MRSSIFLVFILFVLVTCSTVEDVDIGLDKPKLVVNSLFSVDSVWRVRVTNTVNIVDNPMGHGFFQNIQDAVITLYDENNLLIEKLELKPDQNYTTSYRSKKYPEQGKRYTIHVDVNNQPTLKATSSVPERVSIKSVSVDSSQVDSKGEMILDLTFNDPSGIENFYLVKIIEEGYYVRNNDTLRSLNNVYFNPVDPVYQENISSHGAFLNDHLFEGKELNFKLSLRQNYSTAIKKKRKVILFTLTSTYYQYVISHELQRNSTDDPLAQPALIFSNVENGLGIFAGYGVSVFDLN
ncbi:MAG TPA: DUF4249 domain-containing protein [Cyclobacteriaceae bacterium]